MKLKLASSIRARLRSAFTMAVAVPSAVYIPPPPPVDEPPPPVDATVTVTAAEIADYRIFQRVGTSKTITLSGTYTGSPLLIEARLVNADTGVAMTGWTTVDANPVGGNFSGTFNAKQGSWYKLQFRGVTGTGASTPVTAANRFGVGIIGLLIGQSNMVNRRLTGLKNPLGDKRSVEFRAGVWKRAGNINDAAPANTENSDPNYGAPLIQSGRSDGFILLANLLAQAVDLPVCLIEKANSGSSITSWTYGGTNWLAAKAELDAAGGDCEFALWQQGETDANTMSREERLSRLDNLHDQLHAQTGRDATSFKFGIVTIGSGSYGGSSEGEFGAMRAYDIEYATTTPGAYLSTAAHDTQTGDGVHLNGEAYNRIVKRDARSLCHAFGVGVSGAGPFITEATRSGATITVSIGHSGGTNILDGVGGNGAALTGFQVYDNGVLQTISSTAIVGNSIVLTLSTVPSGLVTMSYGMANNPHNSTPSDSKTAVVLASVVYDNVVLHRSANGCPLQPKAAFTVTGA